MIATSASLLESSPLLATLQLYQFLARRTDSGFNAIVAKRLSASKVNRPAMGLARVARYMKFNETKIAVVVGSVTDDIRLEGKSFPKLTIAALKFTEGARARVVAAGGQCLTFDQLALLRPKGENTILLRGRKSTRDAVKHFGAPGVPNSTTQPKIRSEGRKVRRSDDDDDDDREREADEVEESRHGTEKQQRRATPVWREEAAPTRHACGEWEARDYVYLSADRCFHSPPSCHCSLRWAVAAARAGASRYNSALFPINNSCCE